MTAYHKYLFNELKDHVYSLSDTIRSCAYFAIVMLFVYCLLALCLLHQTVIFFNAGTVFLGHYFSPFLKVPSIVPGEE